MNTKYAEMIAKLTQELEFNVKSLVVVQGLFDLLDETPKTPSQKTCLTSIHQSIFPAQDMDGFQTLKTLILELNESRLCTEQKLKKTLADCVKKTQNRNI